MERLPEPGGSRQLRRRPGNLLMTALRVCLPPQPQRGSRGRGAAVPGRRTAPPPRARSGSRGQRAGRAEQPGPSRAPRKEQGEPGVWTMRGSHPMSLLVAQEGPLLSGVRTGLVGRRPRRVREPPGAETGPWPLPPPVQRDGDFPTDGPSRLFLSLATTEHWALRLPDRPVPLAPPLWDSTAGGRVEPAPGRRFGAWSPESQVQKQRRDGRGPRGRGSRWEDPLSCPLPCGCVCGPGSAGGPRCSCWVSAEGALLQEEPATSFLRVRLREQLLRAVELPSQPRCRPAEAETVGGGPRPAHPPLWEEGRQG